MSVWEWIYQIVVEGIKYVILGHWFFGYEFSQKKTRYLLVLYPIMIPLVEAWARYTGTSQIIFYYKCLWGLFLILVIFSGKVIERIKSFLLMWFLIAFFDVIILTPFLIFAGIKEQNTYAIMCIGCISVILWVLLKWKAKRLQMYVQNFWQALSLGEYCLLIAVLLLVSLVMGGIQGYLYDGITIYEKELIFVFGLIATVGFIVICIWFFYTRQMKKRLEEINRLNANYIALQRKYYENSLKQYEDMKSFRHDINHHIYVLSELCKEDKIDELKGYISEMANSYEKIRSIHTGNFIADCIISHVLEELESKENFRFQLDGRFPEKFFMEDIDFCILLSNLLENAREALEKAEGECLLQIEIKRYQEKRYLIICNSVLEDSIDFGHTSKPDERNHGYGIQNVRRVVEKYNGTAQWKQEHGMAVVVLTFEVG